MKFPGETKEYYPYYIVGWLLVVSPAPSLRLVRAAEVRIRRFLFRVSFHNIREIQTFPYLYIEDVWLTGLLRAEMGIEPVGVTVNTA